LVNVADFTNLSNIFFQQTGTQPTLANSIMTAVIGFMMQNGIGSVFSFNGGTGSGGIMSAISRVLGR